MIHQLLLQIHHLDHQMMKMQQFSQLDIPWKLLVILLRCRCIRPGADDCQPCRDVWQQAKCNVNVLWARTTGNDVDISDDCQRCRCVGPGNDCQRCRCIGPGADDWQRCRCIGLGNHWQRCRSIGPGADDYQRCRCIRPGAHNSGAHDQPVIIMMPGKT